jgi:hypothetical protein
MTSVADKDPEATMDALIQRLAGLTSADASCLCQQGVSTANDLLGLTFDDMIALLPASSVLVRRKLANIARFVSSGHTLTATITMADILQQLLALERPILNVQQPLSDSIMHQALVHTTATVANSATIATTAVTAQCSPDKVTVTTRPLPGQGPLHSNPSTKAPAVPPQGTTRTHAATTPGRATASSQDSKQPSSPTKRAGASVDAKVPNDGDGTSCVVPNLDTDDRIATTTNTATVELPPGMYEPPGVDFFNTSRGYFRLIDWLSPDMKQEVDQLQPSNGTQVDATTGNVDKEQLAQVAAQLFYQGRWFRNYMQANQMASRFARAWGFDCVTTGTSIACTHFKTAVKFPLVSNAVACPFVICTAAPRAYKNQRGGPPIVANPVRITRTVFTHTCQPGRDQLQQCRFKEFPMAASAVPPLSIEVIPPHLALATTTPAAAASVPPPLPPESALNVSKERATADTAKSPSQPGNDDDDDDENDSDTVGSALVHNNGLETDALDRRIFGTVAFPAATSQQQQLYEPENVDFYNTEKGYHRKLDWLSPEMKGEVDSHNPAAEDWDDQGRVNKERLAIEAAAIFYKGRLFRNYLQANQMASRFALAWGFHCATAAISIVCSCAKPNSADYVSAVPPDQQRPIRKENSLKKIECPFVIKLCAPRKLKNDKGPPVAANPVRISRTLLHHTCVPSKEQLQKCLRVSGKYSHLFSKPAKPAAKKEKLDNDKLMKLAQVTILAANNDPTLLATLAGMFRSATRILTSAEIPLLPTTKHQGVVDDHAAMEESFRRLVAESSATLLVQTNQADPDRAATKRRRLA